MKQVRVPISCTRALVDVNSYSEKDNTIEVVFATETPVRRFDWGQGEYFNEVLRISKDAVDLTRMEKGAPVLDSHSQWTLRDVIGVVQEVWIDESKKEARAQVRLSEEESDATVVNKIKKGLIRNVSVGYSISEYQLTEANESSIRTLTATKWQPAELSFVAVPADPNSGARTLSGAEGSGVEGKFQNVNISNANKTKMAKETTDQRTADETKPAEIKAPAVAPAAPEVNVDEVRTEAVKLERERVAAITNLCKRTGLDEKISDKLISEGTSLEAARAAIIDEVAKRSNPAPVTSDAKAKGDEGMQEREAAIESLMERMRPGTVEDFGKKTKAREYRNMTFKELAKSRLRSAGINPGLMDDKKMIERAWTTTDYPILFSQAITRTLRRDYDHQVDPWQQLARRESASDFRQKTGVKLDGTSTFGEIPEAGAYPSSPIIQNEDATIKLKRFGQIHTISYETIVNDDLSVLSRIPHIIGVDAQKFQSEKVWALIKNNVNTPDGIALFDASDHANFTSSGGTITINALSVGRTALRRQKSPGGRSIGVAPKYLIVPPELETLAQQFVSQINPEAAGNVNPFVGRLEVLVINELTDTKAWYLAADPNVTTADGIVYSYLDGNEGVNIDSFVDQLSDALVIKANMAFDCAVWGYQGWYKNAGQ